MGLALGWIFVSGSVGVGVGVCVLVTLVGIRVTTGGRGAGADGSNQVTGLKCKLLYDHARRH